MTWKHWTLPATAKPAKRGSASARFALFIAILALFFTVVGIAAGYKHWQRMHDKVRNNVSELAAIKQQLTQAPDDSAIQALRKELTDKANQSQANHTEALQEMARMQSQTRQFCRYRGFASRASDLLASTNAAKCGSSNRQKSGKSPKSPSCYKWLIVNCTSSITRKPQKPA